MKLKLITSIFLATIVLFGLIQPTQATPAAAAYASIPTFSIVSVVTDDSVTIKTYNFPANYTFTVRMGAYGTLGIGGIVVTTTDSGIGGSFTATYDIPEALKGAARIAIRLESKSSGYYAYNWFYNAKSTSSSTTPSGYSGYPYFYIASVVKDESVTIKAYNFPAKDTFNVRMGKYGTLGIGGKVVTTTDSGAGGSFTATYTIPDKYKGLARIAIRLESPTSGYYAYNWFYNNTATGSTGTGSSGSGYTGIPTFTIVSVVKDTSVTIKTKNFPADDTFKVRMGKYGTLGIGGKVVASTDSGDGGSFTVTYDIPASLKGDKRIAIRLQSPTSGYYAYNWFFNNDAP
jgi:hypothetical protein